MSTAENLTIASINTQMGRAIIEPGGLKSLDGVDVLLMQEVLLGDDQLASRLGVETGLTVGKFDPELGLAIALSPKLAVRQQYFKVLKDRGPIGYAVLTAGDNLEKTKFRLRGRGLIGLTVETPNGNTLSAATTHPTVQLRAYSRKAQIRSVPDVISAIQGPLVLGGDMNHWPKPHKVDHEMYEAAALTPVELSGDATFDVANTKYSWLGKLASVGLKIDGQLDAMLYRGEGLEPVNTTLVDVPSDHRAIVTSFTLGTT